MKYKPGRSTVNQRGITLPMLALFIVVLFAFAALAVDVGVLYTARTSAQDAADAAALAGAFTFVTDPIAADPVQEATNAAIAVAGKSKILGTAVVVTAADVVVDTAKQRVTVTVPRTGANGIQTFFAKVIGFNSINVQASATAEAAKSSAGTYCLKPFYMPMSLGTGCGTSMFNADGTIKPQYVGQQVTLWSQIQPSDWGLLDFGANHGSPTIEDAIQSCSTAIQFSCSDNTYVVDDGKRVGPITSAINTLIGDPPDTWQAVGQYVDGTTGIVKDTSKSLVTVVVWDCNTPIAKGANGTVKVAGYGTVFIDSVDKNGVKAHVVNGLKCGTGTATGGTGPFTVPVRLIQTPVAQ